MDYERQVESLKAANAAENDFSVSQAEVSSRQAMLENASDIKVRSVGLCPTYSLQERPVLAFLRALGSSRRCVKEWMHWEDPCLEGSGRRLATLRKVKISHVCVCVHVCPGFIQSVGYSWKSSASQPMARSCLSTLTYTSSPAAATGWWDLMGEKMGLMGKGGCSGWVGPHGSCSPAKARPHY